MSQQGPIIVVSTAGRPSFATALDDAKNISGDDTAWSTVTRHSRSFSRLRFSSRCPRALNRL